MAITRPLRSLDTLMQLQRLRPFFLTGPLSNYTVARSAEDQKAASCCAVCRIYGAACHCVGGQNIQFAVSPRLTGPVLRCTPVECSK